MPCKPKKPCRYPGCPQLSEGRYCAAHTTKVRQTYDRELRPDRCKLYSTAAWIKLRNYKINQTPTCEVCQSQGRTTLATEVHHVKSVEKHPELSFVMSNLQSICKPCHSRITAKENRLWQ